MFLSKLISSSTILLLVSSIFNKKKTATKPNEIGAFSIKCPCQTGLIFKTQTSCLRTYMMQIDLYTTFILKSTPYNEYLWDVIGGNTSCSEQE